MKALVYHGPGEKNWEDVPDPKPEADTDAIVRVDTTTICGTDLHILKGDTPEVTAGRILGHEAVGSGVKSLSVGDRVLVSCISACGACRFCREGHYGQCTGGGGWILGDLIDGTQVEYVRVPFADTSTYRLPAGTNDEETLMLADILSTGYEVGVLNGHVQPGDTVAVVGTGPIGLSAITGARKFWPSHVVAIDLADARLEAAKAFGADLTFNNSHADAVTYERGLTDGLGADVAIEAVGGPGEFRAVHRARPSRWAFREHRRARQARDAAPRVAVDARRDDHDRTRRHLLEPHAASPCRIAPDRRDALRDASLRVFRDARGLRHLPARSRDRRGEGRALALRRLNGSRERDEVVARAVEAPLARAGNVMGGGGHQGGRDPSGRVRPRVPHHDHQRSDRLRLGLRPFLGVFREAGETHRLASPLWTAQTTSSSTCSPERRS
jgi:alcohol dehydrogenase